MSHTTCVSPVSDSPRLSRWPRQTCGMKSSQAFRVSPVSACPAASRAQIRAQISLPAYWFVSASIDGNQDQQRLRTARDRWVSALEGKPTVNGHPVAWWMDGCWRRRQDSPSMIGSWAVETSRPAADWKAAGRPRWSDPCDSSEGRYSRQRKIKRLRSGWLGGDLISAWGSLSG